MESSKTPQPNALIASFAYHLFPSNNPPPTKVSIEDVERLASWNWIKSRNDNPAIVVPGHPPKWNPPPVPTPQLDPDPIDPIQANEEHPYLFEAFFSAVTICNPTFAISDYDVITSAKHLQALLQFGTSHSWLTFDIELHGKLVLIGGKLPHRAEHVFEKAFKKHATKYCTEFERRKVSGYYQAAGYRFDGLKFIVEYPVDCFTCSCHLESDDAHDVCPMNDNRFSFLGKPQEDNHGTLDVWSHGKNQGGRKNPLYRIFNSDCTAAIFVGSDRKLTKFPTSTEAFDQMGFSVLEQALTATDSWRNPGLFTGVTDEPKDLENQIAQVAEDSSTPYPRRLKQISRLMKWICSSLINLPPPENPELARRYVLWYNRRGGIVDCQLRVATEIEPVHRRLLPKGFNLKAI